MQAGTGETETTSTAAGPQPATWPLALGLGLAAALLAVFPLHNDDAGFHLATGRWVLAFGRPPDFNPFSWYGDGATWIQHQWLPAAAMAWLVERGGIPALVLAKAAVVGLAYFAGMFGALRAGLPVAWAALLGPLAVAAAAFRFVERPMWVSGLALAVLAALLAVDTSVGSSRWRRWLTLFLPALALQLHAGGLDGLLLWGALAAGSLLNLRWNRPGAPAVQPTLLAAVAAVALALAGLWLLAPAGLQVLRLPLEFSGNAYWNQHLAEFRPLDLSLEMAPAWALVAAALAFAGLGLRQRQFGPALILLGFAVLAVKHVRMVMPLSLVVLPAVAPIGAGLPRIQPRIQRLLAVLGAAVLLAGAALQVARFGWGLGQDGVDHRRHPLELIDLAGKLPPRAFVSDGLAGTYLWRNFRVPATPQPLPPDTPGLVLVHNCLECYNPETYIKEYQELRYGPPDWRARLDRLGIATLLLKYTTPGERRLQNGAPNLRQLAMQSPDFVLVDFDDAAELLVRRAALPPGTPHLPDLAVDPDTGRIVPGRDRSATIVALQRHAQEHPDQQRVRWLLDRLGVRY
ncbi:MAG: hypothetical protein HY902_17775 [Deltaproteobacteria bacterium]|nr:hypothetical protein [Deltaproteobacteria bacterium]